MESQGVAIEDKLIVATYRVGIDEGDAQSSGDAAEHSPTLVWFAGSEW